MLKVKVEAMTKKVSPVPANPSGELQARNIPTRRFSCQIMKPIPQVRQNPCSFVDMKPTTMVRKNPPLARTFDLRLKEKEHYSDPTFVRTILFSLNENLVYHIGARNRVKPLLEVTRILQRVGPTNLRSVVANRHLILGHSDATLVLPVSMPVKDLSLNTVVGISGAFSPIHIAISGTFSPIHIAPPQSDLIVLFAFGDAPQKPSVRISSDSDIMQKMLNFTHQSAVQYMTFTSSSIERVEHVATLARASHLEVKVKVEAVHKKVSPVPANLSGDPQVRNILIRRFSCES